MLFRPELGLGLRECLPATRGEPAQPRCAPGAGAQHFRALPRPRRWT